MKRLISTLLILAIAITAMAQGVVFEPDGTTLEQASAKAKAENKLIFLDCYTQWCGPCKVLKSTVEEIAEERADVKVVSVDIDEEEDLVDEYEVFSIPCLVAFKGGSEVGRSIGLASKSEIYGALGL